MSYEITKGAAVISAGASSQRTGTIIFSNLNGVSFGLNAGTMTASVVTGGGGAAISAGAASQNTGTVSFADSNGVSFGLNAGTMTATVKTDYQTAGAYLTTQSGQAFSADASSTFQTLVLQDSNGISFSNNAGSLRVTHGLQFTSATSAITSAAMLATSRPAFSADASSTFQTLTLQDSNGISFSNNAGAIRLTHDLQFTSATSAITSAAMLATSRPAFSADASSTYQTLSFQNTSNVSFSNNAGAIRISHNLAGTGTAITGNASITLNSTGLSFNGSGLAGTVTAITGGAIMTFNSAGLSFNGSGLAGTATAATNATFTLNSAGLSLNVAAPGGGATLSYVMVGPEYLTGTLSFSAAPFQSTSHLYPFVAPQALSIGSVRLYYSAAAMAASSTATTTSNTSFSMTGATSHNFVFYSRGVGANSLSLQYVTSTQLVDMCSVRVSAAVGNTSQYSYSVRYTLGNTSFTKDYSQSTNSQQYAVSNMTDLTGQKMVDYPCGLSLSAGQWWLAYGRSSTIVTQNATASVLTRFNVSLNTFMGYSMHTLGAWGIMGGASNSSICLGTPGFGSFTAGGAAGTTNSIAFANISSNASNQGVILQLLRIA